MNKSKILGIALASGALALSTVSSFAEDVNNTPKNGVRCEAVTSRISERVSRYDEGKVRRVNAYNNMVDRLTKLSANLKTKGFTTTTLDSDITTLKGKIAKFEADYASFIAKLKETQGFACGKSDGEFRDKLRESKELLPILRSDAQDIRQYFVNTIKVDIKAIRDQKPNKAL